MWSNFTLKESRIVILLQRAAMVVKLFERGCQQIQNSQNIYSFEWCVMTVSHSYIERIEYVWSGTAALLFEELAKLLLLAMQKLINCAL